MPEPTISPEEKLLDLIRQNKPVSGEKDAVELPKKRKAKKSWKIILPSLDLKSLKGLTQFRLKLLLIFIIILLFCFIGYDVRSGIKVESRISPAFQERISVKKKSQEEPVALKPYSYYIEAIKGKSLFSPLIIEKPVVDIGRGKKIEEICKRYQVKGIIMGEKPQAFIEDITTRRIFTVTIGNTIANIQIKDIEEGRVILGYEEEMYDLFF